MMTFSNPPSPSRNATANSDGSTSGGGGRNTHHNRPVIAIPSRAAYPPRHPASAAAGDTVLAAVATAAQHLLDDMLCAVNRTVEEHNRPRRRSSQPTTTTTGTSLTPQAPPRRKHSGPLMSSDEEDASDPEADHALIRLVTDEPKSPHTKTAPMSATAAPEPLLVVSEGEETPRVSPRTNTTTPLVMLPFMRTLEPTQPQFSDVVRGLSRKELEQLVLGMAEVVHVHVNAANNNNSHAATMTPQLNRNHSRLFDPLNLHSPLVGGMQAGAGAPSAPRSPWVPMSPHHGSLTAFPKPRPSVAFLQSRGVLLAGPTSTLAPPLEPSISFSHVTDFGSITPSSLNTSATSLARPTPKMTQHLEQYTDTEGFTTINNYVLLEQAGAGRYGKVLVAAVNGTSELRAIKMITKSRLRQRWQLLRQQASVVQPALDTTSDGRLSEPSSDHPSTISSLSAATPAAEDPALLALYREVAIMKRLRHKNIVQLFEVIDDPTDQMLYLVMKYVERGPIVKLDAQWRCPPLDMDLVRCIARQSAHGVAYLHRHHIAHRDIKPDNILLGADGVVYLSDFGVSQICDHDDHATNSDGTPAYAAPEIVRGGEYHTLKADIWALGVTMYTLVFGCSPFVAPTIFELNEKIVQQPVDYTVRGDMSHDVDYDDVVDLLQHMLERDPEKRIIASDVVRHPFITPPKSSTSKRPTSEKKRPKTTINTDPCVVSNGDGGAVTSPDRDPASASVSTADVSQTTPFATVDVKESSSLEVTEEETMTAFTPLFPRPPQFNLHGGHGGPVGGGMGGGMGGLPSAFRREWIAFE